MDLDLELAILKLGFIPVLEGAFCELLLKLSLLASVLQFITLLLDSTDGSCDRQRLGYFDRGESGGQALDLNILGRCRLLQLARRPGFSQCGSGLLPHDCRFAPTASSRLCFSAP